MDTRAAKLALARQKLKSHQEKKQNVLIRSDLNVTTDINSTNNTNICNASNENNTVDNETKEIIIYEPNMEVCNRSSPKMKQNINIDMNTAEILISNKMNLEHEVSELQYKVEQLEKALQKETKLNTDSKLQLSSLQLEISNFNLKYNESLQEIIQLSTMIDQLNSKNLSLIDEKNNLLEQLEFTKTILNTKEAQNTSLCNKLNQLKGELDVSKLHMQQLVNGSNTINNESCASINSSEHNDQLQKEVINLERQLVLAQKEKDELYTHYEHYVTELNVQLNALRKTNDDLCKQLNKNEIRENTLVQQISEMEIKTKNLQEKEEIDKKLKDDYSVLQNQLNISQRQLYETIQKYEHLQKLYIEKETEIAELQEEKKSCSHDNISLSKLTADIASDKIAAQRATEQNIVLKTNIHELEEAFIKMSQDKLNMTEKITAEKFLNRELTIKLADCEEKIKELHTNLKAKDNEMIRLQTTYRDVQKKYSDNETDISANSSAGDSLQPLQKVVKEFDGGLNAAENNFLKKENYETENTNILKEDAMVKLQQRFLKIMGEVADLSDEKHRLEHIILQLQNETETICEYVALYQQQRSLLKKRDEERSEQVKLFQTECNKLKSQLEELSNILLRFAEDKDLSTYFKTKSKQEEMDKVRNLLANLKNNFLIHPQSNNLEMKDIYPCNCCSGNLIDI